MKLRKEANIAFEQLCGDYNVSDEIQESETGHNKTAGGSGHAVIIHLKKQF